MRYNSLRLWHVGLSPINAQAGTGRRTLSLVLDPRAQIYTLEVSFYCYVTANGTGVVVPYDQASYAKIGHTLGKSFAEYHM